MSTRLELLSGQIGSSSKISYVESSFDYLSLSSLLTQEQNEIRLKVRSFCDKQVLPFISQYIETASFPGPLLEKVKALNIFHHFLNEPYGKPMSHKGIGSCVAEFARCDASFGTAILLQWALVMYTIEALGSEEQKKKYIPKLRDLQVIGGWALTEEKIGSDAANLNTTVIKMEDGRYKLNGDKRWIGNGNKDVLIVWAKNTETKKVEGFVIDQPHPGVTTSVIKHKMALRPIQNCNIYFKDAILTEANKLPKAKDFAKGTNVILKHSRIFVCWLTAGVCMGAYDHAVKYATSRKQFGQHIAGFQLVQEKLVKMMSNIQAVLLACFRISQLADDNNCTLGQIAMTKAFVTERGREIVKWGREILGGNGIIHENYLMKAFADMEALYTYEGSYDINTLVAGRQITGVSAIKPGGK